MGNVESTSENESQQPRQRQIGGDGQQIVRRKIDIKPKVHCDVRLKIPYKQLSMIQLLQQNYPYEVKGALYFDNDYNFKSFNIRTDNDRLFSSGASDWKIYFHTHPDQTSQKFGLRYYSPPSVDDVMELYDHCRGFLPSTVSARMGEISIVVANEGIYVMQVDRHQYKIVGCDKMSEEQLEDNLNMEFNPFIVKYIKGEIAKIYKREKRGQPDYKNPILTYQQFSRMLKNMCRKISQQFGFKLEFYNWEQLKKSGLVLKTCSYFINKKVAD